MQTTRRKVIGQLGVAAIVGGGGELRIHAQPNEQFRDLTNELVAIGKRAASLPRPRAEHARVFASIVRLVAARMQKLDIDQSVIRELKKALDGTGKDQFVREASGQSVDLESRLKAEAKARGWNLDDSQHVRVPLFDAAHFERTIDGVAAGRVQLSKVCEGVAALADKRADELARAEPFPNYQRVLPMNTQCEGYTYAVRVMQDVMVAFQVMWFFYPVLISMSELFTILGIIFLTFELMEVVCNYIMG